MIKDPPETVDKVDRQSEALVCVLEYREGDRVLSTDQATFPNVSAVRDETERSAIHMVETFRTTADTDDWVVRAVDAAGHVLASVSFGEAFQLSASRITSMDDMPKD